MKPLALDSIEAVIIGAAIAAFTITCLLVGKSLRDYTRSGPTLPQETMRHFRTEAIKTIIRLGFASFLIMFYLSIFGAALLISCASLLGSEPGAFSGFLAGLLSISAISALQFARYLKQNPGVIVASSHYRITRFYPLWRKLNPTLVTRLPIALLLAFVIIVLAGVIAQLAIGSIASGAALALSALVTLLLCTLLHYAPQPTPCHAGAKRDDRPNILLLGCDTLRADRLGASRNGTDLTPNLDSLANRGTRFENCYVPCGRTAPSLVSLFTGTWPQTHGIRDNFTADINIDTPALPETLALSGYKTVAVSDWCGADLGKFNFGFETCDLPEDSWNLKYLIRQGPKDLRLFLSLFSRNSIGKRFLPELYYLGGVPSTDLLGRDVRSHLNNLAQHGQPFLLNAFFSTTHPPFASEYPYYSRFADADYEGPSKFAMARLTDPVEIIRRQGEPRKEFDLDQILALYDGCVKRFDDEVGKILSYLKQSGLEDNTIVVLYSDHGMEFFEHNTWGQGNSVIGEHSARIPLVIADPRAPKQKSISAIIRSIDVAPTLLELAGLDIPQKMEGVSLAPTINGGSHPNLTAYNESGIWLTEVPGQPPNHLRYPEIFELLEVPDLDVGTLAIKPEYQKLVVRAKDRMIRFGKWKLTYQPLERGANLSLFDLDNDPKCLVDISSENPEVVEDMRARLEPWLSENVGK
ncbi:MAG: sulfatase-like hydrolase/transferase [Pseudomonadota bacterium]